MSQFNTIEDILNNTIKCPSGCLLWLGAANKKGYGRVSFNGKSNLAHKIVYEHFYGYVPYGLQVQHKCHVPGCINREHLKLGNNSTNQLERWENHRLVANE